MKAAIIEEGQPHPLLKEVKEPGPPGRGEVLVRVEAAGVCYRDLLNLRGLMPRAKRPVIMGHEFAGVVVEVGEDVEGLATGERVAGLPYSTCGECRYCLEGRVNLCRNRRQLGEERSGSWAEYILVNARDVVKMPRHVDASDASIAGCVLGMLIHALRDRARVRPGEKVLVTGAGGGVGIHAVMVSKLLGCIVIASTSKVSKSEDVRLAGADYVLVGADMLSTKVKEVTGGEGVDVVVECVGEPTFDHSLRSTAWGGRVVVIGNVSVGEARVPLGFIILRENAVVGALGSTINSLREALLLLESGRLKPRVTKIPLEKSSEALEIIERRGNVGKLILVF
ncbi:MAG: alcohol dehydrogenase catalytic domain-containing protein [Nitrososphaerota archaeon]|nr:alcohol dehydrogenase catalytic domain-containing protein [Candidatus Calditenuaceae archaeon]MDW8073723.1 alcohol dehydrogenase catalytic domain-containing protein [Nitrososphaerota archaeon]